MGLDDPWDHLRQTYARRAPGFLASALPGLDPAAVRFVPHHVAHAASRRRSPRRTTTPPTCWSSTAAASRASHLAGRYDEGQLEVLAQPGAAALARAALRGRHRAPRLPAQQRRVQGDGARVVRHAAVPRRAAPRRLHHRRRRLPHRPDRLAVRWSSAARADEEWTADHADLAASVQHRLEEVLLELAGWLHERTGSAGAHAGRRRRAQLRRQHAPARERPVRRRLGAAGRRRRRHRARRRPARGRGRGRRALPMPGADLGRSLERRRPRGVAERPPGCPSSGPRDVAEEVAQCLADNGVVAWFQGRSEYGPRALGHRSLLAHPGSREEPRAAQRRQGPRAVPPGRADGARRRGPPGSSRRGPLPSPYMLFVHDVGPQWRDRIPAVVHVDGTARVQTVRRRRTSRCVHRMLEGVRAAHRAARRRSTPASTPPAARWSTTRVTPWSASARHRSTCWRSAPSSYGGPRACDD